MIFELNEKRQKLIELKETENGVIKTEEISEKDKLCMKAHLAKRYFRNLGNGMVLYVIDL